jgi:hypothetical protein
MLIREEEFDENDIVNFIEISFRILQKAIEISRRMTYGE